MGAAGVPCSASVCVVLCGVPIPVTAYGYRGLKEGNLAERTLRIRQRTLREA